MAIHLGGWFAYEVAARLRATQAQVHLVLLDSYPYCSVPRRARGAYAAVKLLNAATRVGLHLRQLKGLETAAMVPYLTDKATGLTRNLFRPASPAYPPLPSNENAADDGPPLQGSDDMAADYFVAVAARHSITTIDCHVDLIVSEEPRILLPAKILFWRQLATGDLRVHRLRADHVGMMGDERLARCVNRILASRSISGS